MTEVEFIVEKLTPFNWTKEQMQEHYKDAIQQAKEMEKEQIKKERVEAYNNGYANGQNDAYAI